MTDPSFEPATSHHRSSAVSVRRARPKRSKRSAPKVPTSFPSASATPTSRRRHTSSRRCARPSFDPETHHYPSYSGMPELREAIADWMEQAGSATKLDPSTEILPTWGSKEGVVHLPWALLGEGDVALWADPGYPPYDVGARLAGGDTGLAPASRSERLPSGIRRDRAGRGFADEAHVAELSRATRPARRARSTSSNVPLSSPGPPDRWSLTTRRTPRSPTTDTSHRASFRWRALPKWRSSCTPSRRPST